MSIPEGDASTIKFGDGLVVTDEGSDVIRVDASDTALIADIEITATPGEFTTPFDITGIPSSYSDLLGVLTVRCPAGSAVTVVDWRFNNDSGFNYSQRSPTDTDWDDQHYTVGGDSHLRTLAPGTAALPGQFAQHTFVIPGYASTHHHKTVQIDGVVLSSDTGGLLFFQEQIIGFWDSTAAIDRITLLGSNFAVHSRLRLYGRT